MKGARGGASIIFRDGQIFGGLLVFKRNIKGKGDKRKGGRGGAC